jgi:hypothetical protein
MQFIYFTSDINYRLYVIELYINNFGAAKLDINYVQEYANKKGWTPLLQKTQQFDDSKRWFSHYLTIITIFYISYRHSVFTYGSVSIRVRRTQQFDDSKCWFSHYLTIITIFYVSYRHSVFTYGSVSIRVRRTSLSSQTLYTWFMETRWPWYWVAIDGPLCTRIRSEWT